MKIALLIFLSSFQVYTFAQAPTLEWLKKYGAPGEEDVPVHVDTDLQGNVYVGTTVDLGRNDNWIRIAKYSSSGSLLWSKFYVPDFPYFTTFLKAMDVDSIGNVCILANVAADTEYEVLILQKYNSSGTKLWTVKEELPEINVMPSAMAVDKSGNIYVGGTLGYYAYTNHTTADYLVFKYNKNGGKSWGNFYNGSAGESDHLTDLAIDASGNCYVTGVSEQKDANSSIVYRQTTTIKYSSLGYFQWQKHHWYNGAIYNSARHVRTDGSGNAYVLVMYTLPSYTDHFTYVLKYNSAGTLLWTRNLGAFNSLPTSMSVDLSGNSYIAGSINAAGQWNRNFSTHKLNSSGTQLWNALFDGGDSTQDIPSDIAVDRAGNVYVTGGSFLTRTAPFVPERRPTAITIKYTPSGTQRWIAEYGNPATDSLATGTCLALHGTGSEPLVYVAGNTVTVTTGYDEQLEDMLLLKFKPAPLRSLNSALEPLGSVNPPSLFKLAAMPNPFISSTVIRFSLPDDAKVSLKVYDVSGREVRTLINGPRQAGYHQAVFSPVHPVCQQYFYTLQSNSAKGEFRETKPLLLSK